MTTPSSDALDILLAHDTWGTRKLLELCRPLSREPFHRRFEIGRGLLHDSIVHITSAARISADVLAGRPQRPALSPYPIAAWTS